MSVRPKKPSSHGIRNPYPARVSLRARDRAPGRSSCSGLLRRNSVRPEDFRPVTMTLVAVVLTSTLL